MQPWSWISFLWGCLGFAFEVETWERLSARQDKYSQGFHRRPRLTKEGSDLLSVLSIHQLTVQKRVIRALSTECSKSESNQIKRESKKKEWNSFKREPAAVDLPVNQQEPQTNQRWSYKKEKSFKENAFESVSFLGSRAKKQILVSWRRVLKMADDKLAHLSMPLKVS